MVPSREIEERRRAGEIDLMFDLIKIKINSWETHLPLLNRNRNKRQNTSKQNQSRLKSTNNRNKKRRSQLNPPTPMRTFLTKT
jgi:hypothetical protein